VQKGHGVSLNLLQGVRDVGREFFSLPKEEKVRFSMSTESGYRFNSRTPALRFNFANMSQVI
jgi:isopenicillin N synthase-like dioxygenase